MNWRVLIFGLATYAAGIAGTIGLRGICQAIHALCK